MSLVETGCPYQITAPDGSKAMFNVPSDPNFVGYLNDVTGLDMYGIRENAQVIAAGDGGYHGPFWRDRRPWSLDGFFMPTTPLSSRAAAMTKLSGVVGKCLRSDGILNWTPASDGINRGLWFRTQQPLRITPGQSNVQKKFLVAGVSRDWRILKWSTTTVSGTGVSTLTIPTATNGGDADAAPKFVITGPINLPVITNVTTGKKLTFYNATAIAAGQTVTIDLSGVYPTVTWSSGPTDLSGWVDPLNTDWSIAVAPGANTFQLTGGGTTAATGLSVAWSDSWQ